MYPAIFYDKVTLLPVRGRAGAYGIGGSDASGVGMMRGGEAPRASRTVIDDLTTDWEAF